MQIESLTSEQRAELLRTIQLKKEELKFELEKIKRSDKFWFYEPSRTGQLDKERQKFAEKWIHKEDLPQIWTGMDQAIASTKSIVGVFGGNGAGKSALNAMLAHIKMTGQVPESMRDIFPKEKLPTQWPVFGRVYGMSAAMIEEVLVPTFKEWMPKNYWHQEGWERTYNKQEKIMRYFKNGTDFIGHIKFVSCEQDVEKTQGANLDFIHFDEEPTQEFFEEALNRFRTKRMDIAFFMTPTHGMSWTYNMLVDSPNLDTESFKICTLTNQYVDLRNTEIMLQNLESYEAKKMRLLGEFVSLSGLIYGGDTQFQRQVHLIKPFRLQYDEHILYRGLDIHLSKETCCVEVAVLPNNKKVVVGVYWKRGDTDVLKKDLAQRVIERGYRLAWTRYDKSLDYEMKILGDINVIDLLRRPPAPLPALFPSEKYKGSIEGGVDLIKQDLKNGDLLFFDTPEVWLLIKDIQTLEREKGNNEEKKGIRDKIAEGKKDRHASLRYVYQGNPKYIPVEDNSIEPFVEERFI